MQTSMYTAQPNIPTTGYNSGVPALPTRLAGVAPVRSSLVYAQPQHPHSMTLLVQGGHGGSLGETPPAYPAAFYNTAATSEYG